MGKSAPINHDTNFHHVLHGVYKNPGNAKHEQLCLLESLTLQRLEKLNAESLVTVMYAFARSAHRPDPRIPCRMAAACEDAGMEGFTPRQLEHAAWSLAHVGYRPSPAWLDGFARALEANWASFRLDQVAGTMTEAASCGLTRLTGTTLSQQLPAALRRATAAGAFTQPSTVAKLVWSAGHFGCAGGGPAGACTASTSAATDTARQPSTSTQQSSLRSPSTSPPAPDPNTPADSATKVGASSLLSNRWCMSLEDEERLLAWWDIPDVVEATQPADLVLLLCGFARLGMRPVPAMTARMLRTVLEPPAGLAHLDARLLAQLAWSVLKLVEQPLAPAWLEDLQWAFVACLRDARREESGVACGCVGQGSSVGPGLAPAVGDVRGADVAHYQRNERSSSAGGAAAVAEVAQGWSEAQPADVALALSSLAGLGGCDSALESEAHRYWRGPGRWAALSREDQAVLRMLGYGPGSQGGR